jgi:hypothetical protein
MLTFFKVNDVKCHLKDKSGHPFEETILITHLKHMQDNCVMA